ncbi:MAG: cobaltochelatase subunit CobN, partial [Pyrinomonadaceae bacterium]
EKADLLRMVASFDRPEHGARSLPALVAEGLGIHSYEQLLHETPSSEMKELIDTIVKEVVAFFCDNGGDAAANWLNQKARVDREKSAPTFFLLSTIAAQLDLNTEQESLLRALRGEYITPGPGADIVQNPLV